MSEAKFLYSELPTPNSLIVRFLKEHDVGKKLKKKGNPVSLKKRHIHVQRCSGLVLLRGYLICFRVLLTLQSLFTARLLKLTSVAFP